MFTFFHPELLNLMLSLFPMKESKCKKQYWHRYIKNNIFSLDKIARFFEKLVCLFYCSEFAPVDTNHCFTFVQTPELLNLMLSLFTMKQSRRKEQYFSFLETKLLHQEENFLWMSSLDFGQINLFNFEKWSWWDTRSLTPGLQP